MPLPFDCSPSRSIWRRPLPTCLRIHATSSQHAYWLETDCVESVTQPVSRLTEIMTSGPSCRLRSEGGQWAAPRFCDNTPLHKCLAPTAPKLHIGERLEARTYRSRTCAVCLSFCQCAVAASSQVKQALSPPGSSLPSHPHCEELSTARRRQEDMFLADCWIIVVSSASRGD